jgi:hypothetical protein
LFVVQLTAIIACRKFLAIAGKTRKVIRHDGHITGVDKFLPEIGCVLDDAVALMQMDHDRFLARTGWDAEKCIHSVLNLYLCEHR